MGMATLFYDLFSEMVGNKIGSFLCTPCIFFSADFFKPAPLSHFNTIQPAMVSQLDLRPTGFDPLRVWQHSFVDIDHGIFSTVILSLPLIQEGHLSVSGVRMCISTG